MYETWTFFRTVLDNAQQAMARAKLNIAFHYANLSEENFHEQLVADFEKAREVILAITQQKELLDNNSVIQKIIAFRNPYTDVLNLLQVELLRRCRRTSETESELSRNALFLSINGIAAAMQSTG